MMATWMLYCSLCAVALSLAAVLAERALLMGRGPVRMVWVAGLASSLAVPAFAFWFAPRATVTTSLIAPPSDSVITSAFDSVSTTQRAGTQPTAPAVSATTRVSWRERLSRADRPLATAWVVMSLAVFGYFVGGILLLAAMRRRWRSERLLGVDVLVSERTGPALVGAVSPAIVVPEWALAMDTPQLALMLRHEEEHRRARDAQLLAIAQLALMVMPWNVAIWWQILRLRAAVELDCDARVLRSADARSYGDLLLEVARPRGNLPFVVATAFAERAVQLERRIRVMARRRDRAVRATRATAIAVGAMALIVAWGSPRPSVPPRTVALPMPSVLPIAKGPTAATVDTPSSRTSRTAPVPLGAKDTTTSQIRLETSSVSTTRDTSTAATAAVRADTNPVRTGPRSVAFGPGANSEQIIDTVFHRLFGGISLTTDQEAAARSLIRKLEQEQLAQEQMILDSLRVLLPKRMAVQARRDSALVTVVTNDADRSTLTTRLAPLGRGGGGRSAGPGLDAGGGRRGSGGDAGRGGRGGRGAAPLQGVSLEAFVDANFHRLFDGIVLTSEQEASARAALSSAQSELMTMQLPLPVTALGVRVGSPMVLVQAQSDSALAALLTTDADRAILHSRITIVSAPVRVPRP